MVNIYHVISSIDTSTGGPARSVTDLLQALSSKQSSSYNYELFTIESDAPILGSTDANGYSIHFCKKLKKDQVLGLKDTKKPEILHIHGIWDGPTSTAAKVARAAGIPYIYTIRGMLEPWSLTQSRFKKKLALFLYQRELLNKASCLHVTAESEMKSLRDLGFKNPIAIIPNGIDLQKFPPTKKYFSDSNGKRILFLSRIHPKKGLEMLIDIWAGLDNEIKRGWYIDIVGNGDADYIAKLQSQIDLSGLENEIKILPPAYGMDKNKMLLDARLFILPTYSENFGVVIAEALAAYTPVITTQGAPWKDLENYNAGWWTSVDQEAIKIALKEALLSDDASLDEKAIQGRKLVEDKFSIAAVAKDMESLYDWLATNHEQPLFVNSYE